MSQLTPRSPLRPPIKGEVIATYRVGRYVVTERHPSPAVAREKLAYFGGQVTNLTMRAVRPR